MLTLTWIELLLGVFPENLVFIYGIYKISNTPLYMKKFLLSAAVVSVFTYSVRLLPIQFGVHTLILIIIFIVLSVYLNHIEITKAIASVLLLFIIRLITEWFNFFILKEVFNIHTDALFNDSTKKVLYTLPSLFLFFLATYIVSTLKNKKWGKR
jgi:energy-coupling factor transporter transmembrane protein EcfT